MKYLIRSYLFEWLTYSLLAFFAIAILIFIGIAIANWLKRYVPYRIEIHRINKRYREYKRMIKREEKSYKELSKTDIKYKEN